MPRSGDKIGLTKERLTCRVPVLGDREKIKKGASMLLQLDPVVAGVIMFVIILAGLQKAGKV